MGAQRAAKQLPGTVETAVNTGILSTDAFSSLKTMIDMLADGGETKGAVNVSDAQVKLEAFLDRMGKIVEAVDKTRRLCQRCRRSLENLRNALEEAQSECDKVQETADEAAKDAMQEASKAAVELQQELEKPKLKLESTAEEV